MGPGRAFCIKRVVVGVESLSSTLSEIFCCIRQTFMRRCGLFTAQQCKFYSLLQFVIKGLQFYSLLQFIIKGLQFYSLLQFVIKDLPIYCNFFLSAVNRKFSPFLSPLSWLEYSRIYCVFHYNSEIRTYFSWSQNVGKPRPATAAEVSAVEAVAVVEARGGTAEEAAVSDLTPTERGYSLWKVVNNSESNFLSRFFLFSRCNVRYVPNLSIL